jgi:hypothetical protein
MRVLKLATLPVLAILALTPLRSEAQISATIQLGAPQRSWGHEVVVTNYAPEVHGVWATSYRHWTPVTVYYANGHYYPNRIHGARAVMVYRSGGRTFLPPREAAWEGQDHRYNLKFRATDEDYSHAQPPPARSRP